MKVALATKNLHVDSKIRGIGVYTRELSLALSTSFPKDNFLVADSSLTAPDLDLIHYPFFDPFALTLKNHKSIPVVITIHDLIPLKYPSHYPTGIRGRLKWLRQKKAARLVDHIITDSKASKNDIVRLLPVPESRVTVIPLGSSLDKTSAKMSRKAKEEYALPNRYLLYVGDINWNKNVVGLINTFAKLDAPTTHLVLVGKTFTANLDIPEANNIRDAIENSGKKDKIHTLGYVPSHHLPAIYSHATLYVQPSWDEGFGLPVLDAMSRGCPVATSSRGSLCEVGGKSVAYFDPDKDIEKVISDLLASPEDRERLSKLGLTRAKQFSWELAAKRTHEVYAQVIANHS